MAVARAQVVGRGTGKMYLVEQRVIGACGRSRCEEAVSTPATEKLLLRLRDNQSVEAVAFPMTRSTSVCVSSQARIAPNARLEESSDEPPAVWRRNRFLTLSHLD